MTARSADQPDRQPSDESSARPPASIDPAWKTFRPASDRTSLVIESPSPNALGAWVREAASKRNATPWPLLLRAITTLQPDVALQVQTTDAPWLADAAHQSLPLSGDTHAPQQSEHLIFILADSDHALADRSLVAISAKTGYRLVQAGFKGASQSQLRDRLTIDILMVCTGNTCRSPMAEAIAKHLAERLEPGSVPIAVRSAGVAASDGEVYSSEIRESLEKIGVAPPGRSGRSKGLTQDLIEQADVIYAMTSSHLERVHRLHGAVNTGGAIGKAMKLDPAGGDVPDPIGQGQAIYDLTARKLLEMISQRVYQLSQGQT